MEQKNQFMLAVVCSGFSSAHPFVPPWEVCVYILLSWLGVAWAGEIPALVGNDCAPLLLEGLSLRTSLLIGIRLSVLFSLICQQVHNYWDCTT